MEIRISEYPQKKVLMKRRGRVQNIASSSTISGSSVRALFRTKDIVLLPTSTESDALREERKSLLMPHGFIRNELEIDKSWSKHEAISYLEETCFSEKLSSVESSENGFR